MVSVIDDLVNVAKSLSLHLIINQCFFLKFLLMIALITSHIIVHSFRVFLIHLKTQIHKMIGCFFFRHYQSLKQRILKGIL